MDEGLTDELSQSDLRSPGDSGCQVRRPCLSCPWRVDASAAEIPNFSLALAEGLSRTCDGQFGSPMFACHQSREGAEFVCAGWLAVHGGDSIGVRLSVLAGRIPAEALEPGDDWPEMHESFAEMIQKLRDTDHAVPGAKRPYSKPFPSPSPSPGDHP